VVPDVDVLAALVHEELEALLKAALDSSRKSLPTEDLLPLLDPVEPLDLEGLLGTPVPVGFGVPPLG
jgi:hypothetical protein